MEDGELLATMKLIFDFKHHLNLETALSYTLVSILFFLCLRINIIALAMGSESQDESHISLKVRNQPLVDVLKRITLDTGFKFKLNDQWNAYLVNASLENMPLHRGLKLILRGLNHTIIYEPDNSIKIVVYGKVDSRKTDSYAIQSFSSQIQDNQQEPTPSPESSPEETDDIARADDSSEESGPSENTEDKSAENEDSSDTRNEESSEETNTEVDTELDQD